MNRRPHPAADGRLTTPVDAVDTADADTVRTPDSVGVDSVGSVSTDEDVDIVHVYTRRQAVADGVLVDVTVQASPAEMHGGFRVPVAVTAALWAAVRAIPPSLAGIVDVRGRLHDVLWLAAVAVRRGAQRFAVHLPTTGCRARRRELRVEVGHDEDGAPCVTIGFPEDF